MLDLGLTGQLPTQEIRDVAAQYEKGGMSHEAAMIRAVRDRIQLAEMEERSIIKAVRSAWEAQGGPKKAPAVPSLLTEQYLHDKVLFTLDPQNYGGTLTLSRIAGIIGNPDKPGTTVEEAAVESLLSKLIAENVVENIGTEKEPRYRLQQAKANASDEVTSETARRGEYTLKSGESARVIETARRDEFTVYVGDDSMGSFRLKDGKPANIKARATWARDNVREAAQLFAKQEADANDPLAPQRERAAWIPAGDLKTYTAKEAAEEWKRSSAGFKRAIMGRVQRASDDPIVGKAWEEMTPDERRLMHAALNEDHFTGAWYTNTKGQRVNRAWMPAAPEKTAEQLADEAAGERWTAMPFNERESVLYRAGTGVNQDEAAQAKFSTWENMGREFRGKIAAYWKDQDAQAAANPKPAEAAPAPKKAKAPANPTLRLDYGVDAIDGYAQTTEFPGNPGDDIEGGVKDAFLKDVQKYLKAVAATLEEAGFETARDRAGKQLKKAVSANPAGPGVSGDVSLMMSSPAAGRGIYVKIGAEGTRRAASPAGITLMMRTTGLGDPYGGSENLWLEPTLSAQELAGKIMDAVGVARPENSAKLDTNASTKDNNGQGNTRGAGARALGEVATGQDGGAESGGRADRGDAGGGRAGDRADLGSGDASRVSGARSAGSGVEGAHPADAGTTGRGRRAGGRAGRNGSRVSGEDAGARVAVPAAPAIPAVNFRITEDVRLGQGGEVEKFNDNLAAIRTMKAVEAANRRATAEEQATMARYVGWGGLASAFPSPETGQFKDAWAKRGAELRDLLTPKEYALARRSTLDSHYTSQTIVSGMWDAARRLGFRGGLALESSMGAGNFLGLIPFDLQGNTKFIGVEYDSLTARIAALLYPQETVLHSGFQKVPLPDGAFDLAIGNPPFGEQSLRFQFKPELNGHSIHNQFFLASLDALRAGGLQIQVVSRYLMDKVDTSSRAMLAKKAELIGAIRLPDTAFKENARTEVVTDILFLKRRSALEEQEMEAAFEAARTKPLKDREKEFERQRLAALVPDWVKTTTVPDPLGGDPMTVNTYFRAHPEMIMGVLERSGSMKHGNDITVRLDKGENLAARLAAAIATLPEGTPQDQVWIDRSKARFEDMSNSLRIALAGHENGAIRLEAGDVLEQVIERETPEGGYELTKRTLTPTSPWSDSLYLGADGKWYTVEVKLDEKGNPVKQMKGDKPTKLNVYERKVFENEADIPATMLLGAGRHERLTKLVKLRDHLKEQLVLESENAADSAIEDNRSLLAGAYGAFVMAHGYISEPANSSLVSGMPDGALVQALEFGYRPAITPAKAARSKEKVRPASAQPAPILSGRVIVPYEAPTSAGSMADAIAINMAEIGRVDLERIASLLGKSMADIEQEIEADERPLLFKDPETGQWETRSNYLTGQVKRKLNAARAARMPKNVAALEEVQPEPWGADAVTALLGSAWIPPTVYADFVEHVTGSPARVAFSALTNSFSVNAGPTTREKMEEWGSDGYSPAELVSDMLNSAQIKVTYRDMDGKTHVDAERTALALLKAKAIRNEWNDWVFKDGERRKKLVDLFNEKFNTRVARQHDGSHLTLPGKVPDAVISMRRHQKNAIWRGIAERFMLIDHTVGAGKTFTAIARAMERRRMGLSKKPAVIVPNHMVEQFAADVYRLYPGAKVLAAGKADFEKKRRRKLFAKIATGDFDIVIIPHSSFGFIGIAPETEERYLQIELDAAQQAVIDAQEEAEANGEGGGFRKPFGVKEAERLVDRITARMEKVQGDKNKDRLLTFEQMGIDDLTVDEAHEFKNLFYSSRLTGVKGMGNKTGSQKAFDLYNKVRVLRETPTGTVTFMTGTPISNSAVEMYNMMRFLAAGELAELGLEHFDAWRAQYVSTDAGWEPNETGRLKEVNRLGRTWSNMRSLMDLYYSFTDVVDNDDIKKAYAEDNDGAEFPLPRVKGGDRQSVVIQPTKAQVALLEDVLQGFDGLPEIKDPYDRNKARLRLMDRARKVSLDVRAAEPSSPSDEKGGKLDVIADNVKRVYDKWEADRGTQLIFLDRSVPKSKGDDAILKEYDALLAAQRKAVVEDDEAELRRVSEKMERFDPNEMEELRNAQAGGWNAYQQIKDNLIARGIPADEIRFVQEAQNDAQKKALFDAVNDGTVRVLIGSTPRMGAGTNVQKRLVALHHADVTWKPSDIEQREGRIIRQGNSLLDKYGIGNFEVEILAYATERTIDAKMWSLNASKLKTINAIRKYDGAFSMDFEDEDSVSMAELAALASGDPLLLERVQLMSEIDKLELLKRQHSRREWGITSQIEDAERDIERLPLRIAAAQEDHAAAVAGAEEMEASRFGRTVTVEGTTYTDGEAARKAVVEAYKAQGGEDEGAKISISVGKRRLTSLDGALGAVSSAMGDEQTFSMFVNGAEYIARTDAAREIAELAKDKSVGLEKGEAVTVDLGTFRGLKLSATFERFDSGGYQTSLAVLRPDGTTMASGETKWREKWDYSTSAMRSAVEDLDRVMNPDSFQYRAEDMKRRLARAHEILPDLRARKGGGFPQQDELEAKNKRLEEVIRLLSEGPATPARSIALRVNPLRNVDGSYRRQAPALNVMQPEQGYGYNDPYENVQSRPGTNEAQREAGRAAVDDLSRRVGAHHLRERGDGNSGARGTVLGSRLLANFVAGKPNQLIGQVAATPRDLAALAQVYRDPRFETFRIFYMKGDKIVGEAGYTSRLPSAAAIPSGWEGSVKQDMARFGADGYYILHNHPSGDPSPSIEDQDMTVRFSQAIPGLRAHVVIDHDRYATIDQAGTYGVISAPWLNGVDFTDQPEREHKLLDTLVTDPAGVAGIGKALQIPQGHASLVMLDSKSSVQLLVDVPMGALTDMSPLGILKIKALVRRMARETGSGGLRFIVLPDGVDTTQFAPLIEQAVFKDVVSADGKSARELGVPELENDYLRGAHRIHDVRESGSTYRGAERRATDRTIEIDGARRPITNSKGKTIADDFMKQLAFYRWFKDSKVTDEQGRPLIVYHGSIVRDSERAPGMGDIQQFDRLFTTKFRAHSVDTMGNWFSTNPGEGGAQMYAGRGQGSVIYPVYLSIQNPHETTFRLLQRRARLLANGEDDGRKLGQAEVDAYRKWLKDMGKDGIKIVHDEYDETGSTEFRDQTAWITLEPEQIKSATGNGGGFDPGSPLIVGSREGAYTVGGIAGALAGAANSAANVRLPAGYMVGDLFNQSGKVSWWHKTIGTMDNLARRAPLFAPVYEAVQKFLGDVSRYAVLAADKAPTLLPHLDSIKDILGKNRKKPLTAADTKAIAAPIFEGTLIWARDAHGNPVKIQQLEEEAERLTIEQKAEILLQKGVITDEQNIAWLASPLDFYDATIERRFTESQLKPGVVWTNAELRSMFDLSDAQIAMYREFRAATDASLTNLSLSEMVKLGGKDSAGMLEQAVEAGGLMAGAELLRDHFIELAQSDPDKETMHLDTASRIMDVADRAQDLMDRGYAPLSRFGKHTVYVQQANEDGEMEQVYFGMFETQFEASRMARQMREGHPGAQVLQGTVSDEAYKLFAGVSPETIELFGSMVGLDTQADAKSTEVYQTYLKLARSNRSAMKRMIHRKGIAGFNEDAGRVLANFIYSNARLTAGNANLGKIDEAITAIPKQEGELTDAAMELRAHIRDPQGGGHMLGGLMFAQFLGGSVASALVNMTQPFTMTLPFLSQWGGIGKAGARLAGAIRDAGKEQTGDAALDAALKWATEEGIVAPQEVHYLQAQAAGKGALQSGDGTKVGDARATLNNAIAKVSLGWGKLFAMAELANRRVTFIAAYRTAVEQGMADPARFAQEAVTQTQGTYNSGNKPRWARSTIGGLALTFKQYSIAYVELLTRMLNAGEPGSPERAAGRRAALYMIAVLFLMGGADGLPFEQDLEDLIDGILQRLGYNFSTKREKQEFLTEVLGEGGADFALKGISSLPGMPVDVSGRFGMGNLIPATGLLTKKESYTRDIGELAGPAGDLATRAFKATGKALGGDIDGAALEMSPVAIRNAAKGLEMGSSGAYLDARGYKVNDVSATEAGMKILGFQPNSTADIQDAKGQALNMISQTRMRSQEIAEHWAQGIASNKPEMVAEARAWRDDWNSKNPETRINVNMAAVLRRVKSMRQDALRRTSMTAPKALKQSVRAELSETRD